MPLASAADTPNLMNTLDKEKFVNAVSNNTTTDKTAALNNEEKAKLQKYIKDKNLTNDNGLKLGSTGDQVTKLQQWLKDNGFYTGNVDGNFGADTETAVKLFQKEVGLREDGQVGDYTLAAMSQWDEIKADMKGESTASAGSSNEKVYSNAAKSSAAYSTAKKSYSNSYSRSYSSGYGYTNGMDCWAMSDYISGNLRSQGYTTRTIQYGTSMASNHRSVQYYNGGSWVNYDYAGNGYNNIYYATGNSANGVVVG